MSPAGPILQGQTAHERATWDALSRALSILAAVAMDDETLR